MSKISTPIATVFTKFRQLFSFSSKKVTQAAPNLGKLQEDTDVVIISRKALGIVTSEHNVPKTAVQTTPLPSSQITTSAITKAKPIESRLALSINYENYPYYNQPRKLTAANIVPK